jgi:hypothetical protein
LTNCELQAFTDEMDVQSVREKLAEACEYLKIDRKIIHSIVNAIFEVSEFSGTQRCRRCDVM